LSGIVQGRTFTILDNGTAKDKSIQNIMVYGSYSLYKKYNNNIFIDKGYRFLEKEILSYLALKIDCKIGQFDDIDDIDNVYSINGATSQIVQRQTVYKPINQFLERRPIQELGIDYRIIVVGGGKWIAISTTIESIKGINSGSIDKSTLRADLLFKIPSKKPCAVKFSHNISFGINVIFQKSRAPVYGLGANIPFAN
jgi:hypothetical protein